MTEIIIWFVGWVLLYTGLMVYNDTNRYSDQAIEFFFVTMFWPIFLIAILVFIPLALSFFLGFCLMWGIRYIFRKIRK